MRIWVEWLGMPIKECPGGNYGAGQAVSSEQGLPWKSDVHWALQLTKTPKPGAFLARYGHAIASIVCLIVVAYLFHCLPRPQRPAQDSHCFRCSRVHRVSPDKSAQLHSRNPSCPHADSQLSTMTSRQSLLHTKHGACARKIYIG